MHPETNNTNSTQKKIVTIPNILSFFRLCLIPVIIWLYIGEKNYLWAGIVLILSGATDLADGFIARHFHMISDLGKVLDPVADKLTQAAMLFCLCTRFPLMILPLVLMIVKEGFMGISGIMIIRKTGSVFGADWHGKAATVLLYAAMIVHVFWYEVPVLVSDLMIGACSLMIVISLILYAKHNIGILKGEKRK
ncbi:phosphatidylglycerophosphate synthase [Lachnoclostridium sp. An131]|uniref:CDP-alcohol phosphatidyltransferase family protein n=1 Tax=Lachnoclostridium sp. An131 TaxID=1965555 RepID=UPI000B36C030|nr:CDP-alcohol phosphatidyltransferase family protein [Lachnoclostridium sp. An131]OUQ24422.1 phosphatidylglycerophosphate synthase [Lachnoclostridium sp. An131]